MRLIQPQQSSRQRLAIRQTEDARNSLTCVNIFGGEWMVCASGFRGCCERASCRWCEANGGIDIGTTGPLVSTAAPTTTQPAVTIVAEHSHSTNDGLATLTSARYTETGTVTVYQTVNSTPTSTIITCAPTTIATSSVAPVTESSSSDSMINIVYIAILIGVVVLSALVFGVFFLRRRRRARPITPIQETIEVSSPRASSLFTDLKKRISVFVSPPSPGVGYENHHFLLPQELQGDAEHCVELPAVEMQEK